MFEVTVVESIYILSTLFAALMWFLCLNEMMYNIDRNFIKLERDRETLENQIQILEKVIKELKETKEFKNDKNYLYNKNASIHYANLIGEEINQILVSENKKLHVRCDMLEEEIQRIRQTSITGNRFKKFKVEPALIKDEQKIIGKNPAYKSSFASSFVFP